MLSRDRRVPGGGITLARRAVTSEASRRARIRVAAAVQGFAEIDETGVGHGLCSGWKALEIRGQVIHVLVRQQHGLAAHERIDATAVLERL